MVFMVAVGGRRHEGKDRDDQCTDARGHTDAIQGRTTGEQTSQSKILATLIDDALNMQGRDGMATRIAVLEATVAEQERILMRAGKRTPKRKRVSVGMTLAETRQIDAAAHAAGMTRAEFLRSRIFGPTAERRALEVTSPALPA